MHFSSKVSIGSCRAGQGIVIPHQHPYGMGKYGNGQGMYWAAIAAIFKIAEKIVIIIIISCNYNCYRAGQGIVIPHQHPYGMGKYGNGQGMYWAAIAAIFKIAEKCTYTKVKKVKCFMN